MATNYDSSKRTPKWVKKTLLMANASSSAKFDFGSATLKEVNPEKANVNRKKRKSFVTKKKVYIACAVVLCIAFIISIILAANAANSAKLDESGAYVTVSEEEGQVGNQSETPAPDPAQENPVQTSESTSASVGNASNIGGGAPIVATVDAKAETPATDGTQTDDSEGQEGLVADDEQSQIGGETASPTSGQIGEDEQKTDDETSSGQAGEDEQDTDDETYNPSGMSTEDLDDLVVWKD